jgi:DHA1 family bicyclomycin/chloramphenicol resistance-like MFS transporter
MEKTNLFKPTKELSFVEFVALMASMIALAAISTDAMLPALPEIGRELGAAQANDSQLILSLLFLGMAIGQIFYGPVSDSIGRKPAIYAGLAIFMAGCLLSMIATTFPMMLAARMLQGLGIAGPRSLATAVVRDRFSGRMMARVMSFIMTIFILVPIVAPAIGQGILLFAGWRSIFGFLFVFAIVVFVLFLIIQTETLAPEDRIPFSAKRITSAFKEVFTNRIALGFTIAAGLFSGAFLGYLNSAQPVFQDLYGLGERFPLIFAVIAISSGVASFVNARLVLRFGMRWLTTTANTSLTILSALYFIYAYTQQGHPPLWTFIAYFLLNFFAVGIMFGNLNSMAMEPLGHIAGVGAAVVGSLSNFISIPIGVAIGRAFNGTVLPLIGGFAIMCLATIFVMRWADSGDTQQTFENNRPVEKPTG